MSYIKVNTIMFLTLLAIGVKVKGSTPPPQLKRTNYVYTGMVIESGKDRLDMIVIGICLGWWLKSVIAKRKEGLQRVFLKESLKTAASLLVYFMAYWLLLYSLKVIVGPVACGGDDGF